MKYTQLIRLIFSNTDGTAYVNFTDIFFPVKSIVVSNAFYSTTTPQQLNPTLVMGIETNIHVFIKNQLLQKVKKLKREMLLPTVQLSAKVDWHWAETFWFVSYL